MGSVFFLLTAFAVWHQALGDGDCPPDKDIYPCFCFVEEPHRVVTTLMCDKVNDLAQIRKILGNVRGKNISLSFDSSRLGDIPSDFFSGLMTPEITFEECDIKSFGDRPFSGLEDTLLRLSIYDSVGKGSSEFEAIPLSHLKKLHSFALEEHYIDHFGNEWFADGPTTLKHVSLEVNDIEELGDRVFAPLINIEQIWIGDNQIRDLSRSMFPRPAAKLEILELGLMQLESFPEDIFQDMPSLVEINLTGNKLITLPQKTWEPVWNQLQQLYLEHNREMVCDERIRWIYERSERPKTFRGQCYGSNALTGKDLSKLSLSDFSA